jgi:SAM-dependent methyltransferase
MSVADEFGGMDIYLFDQIQKGRFDGARRVLDVGCGVGRNLVWFLRHGYEVFGVDRHEEMIDRVRRLAGELQPDLPAENFFAGELRDAGLAGRSMDAVICCAVLHFSRNREEFAGLLHEMWGLLKPGGILFTRLASDIGIEEQVESIDGRWAKLPDGTERYLVDEMTILNYTAELGGELLDPIKTTNVQGMRCMTTWVLRKNVTRL